MRELLAALLVGAILNCPFICGAGDLDHDARGHEPANGAESAPGVPVHCPDEGGDCVCQGAVRSFENKSHKAAGEFRLPGFPRVDLRGVNQRGGGFEAPDRLLTWGEPNRGDATSVRAVLQNYRC